jgi:hypothetical protein
MRLFAAAVLCATGSLALPRELQAQGGGDAPPLLGPLVEGSNPVQCTTESEFWMNGYGFLTDVCKGAGEECGDGGRGFPTSCRTATCRMAVDRVFSGCRTFASSDQFFAAQWAQISGQHELCQRQPPSTQALRKILVAEGDPDRIVSGGDACGATLLDLQNFGVCVETASVSAPGNRAACGAVNKLIRDTGSTVVLDPRLACEGIQGGVCTYVGANSGGGETPWSGGVTLQAPPGKLFKFVFDEMQLPSGFGLDLYDGFDDQCELLRRFTKTREVPEPFTSNGWLVHVKMVQVGDSAVSMGRAKGFSAKVTCICSTATEGSCGPHGTCVVEGQCRCDPGYHGEMCSDSKSDQQEQEPEPEPEPEPETVFTCGSCPQYYSCINPADEGTPGCWPDAVRLVGQLLSPPAHSGYLGVFTRVATTCTGAPVYMRPSSQGQGQAPAYLHLVKAAQFDNIVSFWVAKPGAGSGLNTVQCANIGASLDTSGCPFDSNPIQPFEVGATGCAGSWRECTAHGVGAGSADMCLPFPAQDTQFRTNPNLRVEVVQMPAGPTQGSHGANLIDIGGVLPPGHDPCKHCFGGTSCSVGLGIAGCWPDVYRLRDTGLPHPVDRSNAGFAGVYSRAALACNGAPVYIRPYAKVVIPTGSLAGSIWSRYPGYLYKLPARSAADGLRLSSDRWAFAFGATSHNEDMLGQGSGLDDCATLQSNIVFVSDKGECINGPDGAGCEGPQWYECAGERCSFSLDSEWQSQQYTAVGLSVAPLPAESEWATASPAPSH